MTDQPGRHRAQALVDAVHRLEQASDQARAWMSPGGICCLAPRTSNDYCTNPGCGVSHDRYSAMWAREAAHEANAITAALAAAEAHAECPHGGECGCSIATRHEWYAWKGDERLKREAAEARVAQLEQLVREMLDAKNLIEQDAMKAEGNNRKGVELLQRRLTLANEMREAAEARAAQAEREMDKLVDQDTRLREDVARLRAALEHVEWCIDPESGNVSCHWCGAIHAMTNAADPAHKADCPRQAALKAQP